MIPDRFPVIFALLCLGAAATGADPASAAGSTAAERSQPFTVEDLVRLERVSDLASSPDGKRVAYTLRTTEMEANKGRTGIWLLDTRKRGGTALRLTDIAANSNSAEWSADGRFIYFLSNRGGSTQVWRVAAGVLGARGAARRSGAR